jgi:hypothetical protein
MTVSGPHMDELAWLNCSSAIDWPENLIASLTKFNNFSCKYGTLKTERSRSVLLSPVIDVFGASI